MHLCSNFFAWRSTVQRYCILFHAPCFEERLYYSFPVWQYCCNVTLLYTYAFPIQQSCCYAYHIIERSHSALSNYPVQSFVYPIPHG